MYQDPFGFAHVFTTFRVAPVLDHPLHAVHVPALQVRERVCSYSQVLVPVSPTGQAADPLSHWLSLEFPEQVEATQLSTKFLVEPVAAGTLQVP